MNEFYISNLIMPTSNPPKPIHLTPLLILYFYLCPYPNYIRESPSVSQLALLTSYSFGFKHQIAYLHLKWINAVKGNFSNFHIMICQVTYKKNSCEQPTIKTQFLFCFWEYIYIYIYKLFKMQYIKYTKHLFIIIV